MRTRERPTPPCPPPAVAHPRPRAGCPAAWRPPRWGCARGPSATSWKAARGGRSSHVSTFDGARGLRLSGHQTLHALGGVLEPASASVCRPRRGGWCGPDATAPLGLRSGAISHATSWKRRAVSARQYVRLTARAMNIFCCSCSSRLACSRHDHET